MEEISSPTPKRFQNKSAHPQQQTKQKRASVEEGDLSVGVTPTGRGGFLSSICCSHFTVTTAYLYSTVMFGISLEGEPQPLFSLERDGNQRVSVCRLRFLDQSYLLLINTRSSPLLETEVVVVKLSLSECGAAVE